MKILLKTIILLLLCISVIKSDCAAQDIESIDCKSPCTWVQTSSETCYHTEAVLNGRCIEEFERNKKCMSNCFFRKGRGNCIALNDGQMVKMVQKLKLQEKEHKINDKIK